MAEKIATRASYGKALVELGAENPDIVVLDADLSGSTQTKKFADVYPDRFFNAGIAEANMMGMAAGLAVSGKTVFASSFAMFASGRAYEIIRNSIGYPRANVKICASHAGVTVGEDGASHQCIEDLSLMRGIPGMTVLNPADDVSARALIKAAAAYDGPVYVRLGRSAVPVVYEEGEAFEIGRAKRVREGRDACIIAAGIMLDKDDFNAVFSGSVDQSESSVRKSIEGIQILVNQSFLHVNNQQNHLSSPPQVPICLLPFHQYCRPNRFPIQKHIDKRESGRINVYRGFLVRYRT